MTLDDSKIREFVVHWTMHRNAHVDELLADDFVYRSEIETHGREDFILATSNREPWQHVEILGIMTGAVQAAAFFEGTDPTTNLAHRVAWLLDYDEHGIHVLREVSCILNRPSLRDWRS